MDASVVIVNYKAGELLARCVESVIEHTKYCSYEIFLIDNASGDDTAEKISKKFPKINFIQNKKNLGFATACNQCIKESTGDFILLLNPDTELFNDSISETVARMKKEPEVGIAGIHLLNPDRSHQSFSVRRFPTLMDQLMILFKFPHFFGIVGPLKRYMMIDFDYSRDSLVDQVMGAFFCINKKLIDEIGPLDENFFLWFEEVDFCKRAKDANWKVKYFANIEAIHHRGVSFAQVNTFKKQIILLRSMLLYFKKHL